MALIPLQMVDVNSSFVHRNDKFHFMSFPLLGIWDRLGHPLTFHCENFVQIQSS